MVRILIKICIFLDVFIVIKDIVFMKFDIIFSKWVIELNFYFLLYIWL